MLSSIKKLFKLSFFKYIYNGLTRKLELTILDFFLNSFDSHIYNGLT